MFKHRLYKTKKWIAYHKALEQLIEKINSDKQSNGGTATFSFGELKVTLSIDFNIEEKDVK